MYESSLCPPWQEKIKRLRYVNHPAHCPFGHLSLHNLQRKKGVRFVALGNKKKKQCIAMLFDITISWTEHLSELEETPRRC